MRQRHPVGPAREGRRRKLAALLMAMATLLVVGSLGGPGPAGAQTDPVDEPAPVIGEEPPPVIEPEPPVIEPEPPVIEPEPPGDDELAVTVTTDAAAVPETGADVLYIVTVENRGDAGIELDRLIDDRFGNLNGDGTCAVGGLIAPGEVYTCEATWTVVGPVDVDHVNTVTATATVIEEGRRITGEGSASVQIIDLTPAITLTYTANRESVLSPGENVAFSVTIVNDSSATDPVTITSLTDSVQGDLSGIGTCTTPRTIAPGRQLTCAFTALIDQDDHVGSLTVVGADDEGTGVIASAEVLIDLVNPALSLVATVNADDAEEEPGPYVEAGQVVDLTYTVTNDGDVSMVDIRVTDDKRVTVTCPDLEVAPGETMLCTGSTRAEPGQNLHTASLRGAYVAPSGDKAWRTDTDVTHFFGSEPAATIVIGPELQAVTPGGQASFTVTVTNTGNVPLTEVATASETIAGCGASLADLAPGGTETYECTSAAVDVGLDGLIELRATPPVGDGVSATASARIMLPVGRIAPSATSCADFLDGVGEDLGQLDYNVGRSNRILSVSPGLFTYYTVLTVDAGTVVTLDQVDDGSTPAFNIYQTSQALLLNPDCTRAQTGRSARGSSTVTFSTVATGTYVMSVKFTPDSARSSMNPGLVTYEFTTSVDGEPLPSTAATIVLGPR